MQLLLSLIDRTLKYATLRRALRTLLLVVLTTAQGGIIAHCTSSRT
jgi:hypothetical protein